VLLEPKWSQKDLNFKVRMDKNRLTGDEELIQQVWVNLIENAVKFSRQGGTIEVSIRKPNISRRRESKTTASAWTRRRSKGSSNAFIREIPATPTREAAGLVHRKADP
jgi:signal transduction histidine kinase